MAKRNVNIKTTDKTNYEQSTQMTTSASAQPLSREKLEEVNAVESIGLYDDLSSLKIDPSLYSKKEGEYGIPFKRPVHILETNDRIMDHQKKAAELFLADLRGFGLLADCVGSGKTYEACVVISELAVRGRIENLLIIVPDLALLKKWTHVVEKEFGFGKGNLQAIKNLNLIADVENIPEKQCKKPSGAYIMTYDAFAKSGIDKIKSYLFDLIVVDEAHNLCDPKKEYMQSMYYLSLLMQTKKRCDKPFCLLLTATPHSGNLTHMFNLWYFIRCKGGIPECFTKDGRPEERDRAEFEREKAYYTNVVCKGATTVAEYVAKAECEFLVGMRGMQTAIRDKFFSAFDAVVYRSGERSFVTYEAIDEEDYRKLKECQKKSRAQAFLSLPENAEIKAAALSAVNHSYTNTVMRAIMVRRRNEFSLKRSAYSYFFLPIDKKVPIEAHPVKPGQIPLLTVDGVSYQTEDEIEDFFAESSNRTVIDALFEKNRHFAVNGGAGQSGFAKFYAKILADLSQRDEPSDYLRICQVPCTLENEENKIFEAKCDRFISLLNDSRSRDKSHRVIVFFDYKKEENSEIDESNASWTKLLNYLEKKAPHLARDVIHGRYEDINERIADYEKNENGILFAEDQAFTEGQDLQKGNVVINFEVPVDPLTVDQRIGRVYRMGQAESEVEVYSFATMSRIDGYCLGYFAAIGILSDTDGDATILSGCNSDNMKVLRCPSCKDVSLIYESDYEENLPECPKCKAAGIDGVKMDPRPIPNDKGGRDEIFVCKRDESHKMPIPASSPLRCSCEKSPLRDPIVINEFVCEKHSTHRIKRSKEKGYDYVCMSQTHIRNKMMRTEDAKGNILVGCSKLCAFRNCPYKKSGCQLRKKLASITTEEEARYLCSTCSQFDTCDCRIDNGDRPNDKSVKNSCFYCKDFKSAGRFPCMQPYTINFGRDYETGNCPICGNLLKQRKENTFETFIVGRYENDRAFADNFLREMDTTLQIKEILKFN